MDSHPGGGRVVGRYVLYDEIASGGMATVHLGRMLGQVGFARIVAVKKLHPHLARDPEFVAMFLDEARLAAGVRHPNVVATLDVVATTGELFLVMEYVEGDSLSHLIRATRRASAYIPPPIVSSIACGMLYGLHAAHVASDDRGNPLKIVHRDVSPQNILIGVDGAIRVADFGVAKASRRLMETEAGRMKGKFSYMSPEQVRRDAIDHRADVFSAGICTWEALTGRHLFAADEPGRAIVKLLEMPIEPPSHFAANIPAEVDAIVLRALERDPDKRFQSAREMAIALEDALPPAIPRKVGEWAEKHVGEMLQLRNRRLAEMQLDGKSEKELVEIAREISSQSVAPPPADAGQTSAPDVTDISGPPLSEQSPASTDSAPQASASSDVAAEPPPAPEPESPAAAPYASADTGTPVSQISQMSGVLSASYTEPPPIPPERWRPPRTAIVAGALGTIIALGAVILLLTSSGGPSSEPSTPQVAAPPAKRAEPSPPAQAEPSPTPEVKPISPPQAEPTPKPEPEPIVTPAPPPAPKATATATAKSTAAPKPSAQPPAPAKAGCNPPYTIENGIKKFKRHCL